MTVVYLINVSYCTSERKKKVKFYNVIRRCTVRTMFEICTDETRRVSGRGTCTTT